MDSGWAAPTLSPGFRETVAAKFLMVARVRAIGWIGAALSTARAAAVAAFPASFFMLMRMARFLAEDSAGKSMAATSAIMAMTTRSSISVNACLLGSFMSHLKVRVTRSQEKRQHKGCQPVIGRN